MLNTSLFLTLSYGYQWKLCSLCDTCTRHTLQPLGNGKRSGRLWRSTRYMCDSRHWCCKRMKHTHKNCHAQGKGTVLKNFKMNKNNISNFTACCLLLISTSTLSVTVKGKVSVFNLRLLSARLCFMLGLRSFLPAGAVLVLLAATSDLDLDCLVKHSGFTVMHCFGESGCAGDLPESEARMVTWEDIVIAHWIHLRCFKKNGSIMFQVGTLKPLFLEEGPPELSVS